MSSHWKPGDEVPRVRVSREYINSFANQLDAINKAANKTLYNQLSKNALIDKLNYYNEIDKLTFDTVAEIMDMTARGSTKLSSALTCQFYDGIRDAANLQDDFKAELWTEYSSGEIRAASYAIMEEAIAGTNTALVTDLLGNVLDRANKNASDATVRHNARRDPSKPRYASVPTSSTPCAWCVMRASQGYVYYDEKSVTHSHHHCKCIAVPSFRGMSIQDYDPDAYLSQYEEAQEALAHGDIPEEMEDRFARERAEKGRDYDRTNEVLAVMRHHQGIS